jgi:hypothetical protein
MFEHDPALWDVFQVPPNFMYRICIPARMKPTLLAQLQKMNIDARTLFPGVDGVGRSIREHFIARLG